MAKLRIKEVAEEKGIKQSHLQIMAAVTPPLLNRYWNNKTGTVSLSDLEKIAKALGVKSRDLIIDDCEAVEEISRKKKKVKEAIPQNEAA
jgi:transcriptional regulator with XRE-family HTH domain